MNALPENAAIDIVISNETGSGTWVDRLTEAMARPDGDIVAFVAALPPDLNVPASSESDPVALRRLLAATLEQVPVYRIYLTEKVLIVAPGMESVRPDIGLIELGLNSMDAAAVLTTVEAELSLEIPIDAITKGASVNDLAVWLAVRTALSEAG